MLKRCTPCEAILQTMKLNQLDGLMAFWKVAEHRSFTAAAAELGVFALSPESSDPPPGSPPRRAAAKPNHPQREPDGSWRGLPGADRAPPSREVREAGEQTACRCSGRPSGVCA